MRNHVSISTSYKQTQLTLSYKINTQKHQSGYHNSRINGYRKSKRYKISAFCFCLISSSVLQGHSVSVFFHPKWWLVCSHAIYTLNAEYFVRMDGTGPKQCCTTASGATAEQGGDTCSILLVKQQRSHH